MEAQLRKSNDDNAIIQRQLDDLYETQVRFLSLSSLRVVILILFKFADSRSSVPSQECDKHLISFEFWLTRFLQQRVELEGDLADAFDQNATLSRRILDIEEEAEVILQRLLWASYI